MGKNIYKPTDPKLVAIRKDRIWSGGNKKIKVPLTEEQKANRKKAGF